MWSKFATVLLTALFIVAVGNPVVSHDGSVPAVMDFTQDEQPWGGEHNYDPPEPPLESYPDPGKLPGEYYFIRLSLDYGWMNIRTLVIDIFDFDSNSDKTGQTHTLDETLTETSNQDAGVGAR